MSKFDYRYLDIPGMFTMKIPVFEDMRGRLLKVFEMSDMLRSISFPFVFKESYISTSQKCVFRGFHFQVNDPQGKLIVPISGKFIDYVIDMRKGSPTFGQLSVNTLYPGISLYVPRGMAHGMVSVEEGSIYVAYQTSEYMPGKEGGVSYLTIEQMGETLPCQDLILSEKDRALDIWDGVSSVMDFNIYNVY